MSSPEQPESAATVSLAAAVEAFVSARRLALSADDPQEAPEEGQIWGTIGSLMGLSKAERQERQKEITDAFTIAWTAAGGIPRTIAPKKARAIQRKKKIKQIKSKRDAAAKVVPLTPPASGSA